MCPGKTAGGEMTRAAILAAAYQLFAENGYHGTSMRAIAARAGITAGSIYNHFEDKEQIVQSVILTYHPIVQVLPRLSEVQGATAEALIREAAQRIAAEVEADPQVLRLVFIELVDLNGQHVPALIQAMLPQVEQFLDRVFASGEIAHPRDPAVFFSAFVGMLLGYAFTHVFLEQLPYPPGAEHSLETYIDAFLWGAIRRPPEGQP